MRKALEWVTKIYYYKSEHEMILHIDRMQHYGYKVKESYENKNLPDGYKWTALFFKGNIM